MHRCPPYAQPRITRLGSYPSTTALQSPWKSLASYGSGDSISKPINSIIKIMIQNVSDHNLFCKPLLHSYIQNRLLPI